MSGWIMLAAAILPAAMLWLYIWKKDSQPEPTSWLVKAVLLGIGICIPVVIVEIGIEMFLYSVGIVPTNLVGTTMQAFVVAAIPEEAFKLLALWLILRKNPYFDEHFDGIVYAVCVGLGFAAIENVFYILGEEEWMSVAISRALLAVPAHYAFAILMGYYYSVYHFVDHSTKNAICILLVPVMAHGIYNAIALSGSVNPFIGGVSFFVLLFFCIKMHKVAKAKMLEQIREDSILT